MSESFTYNYSAERQSEIDAIRKKYLPPEEQENKLEQLRKLDARAPSFSAQGCAAFWCGGFGPWGRFCAWLA